MSLSRCRAASPGFSLIELLITFAIMVVVISMLYGFGSARHQRTQKQLCADNLQKMFVAAQIYAQDFGGRFPVVTNAVTAEDALGILVPKYSTDTSIFICPGGRDAALPAGEPLRGHTIRYAYFMGRREGAPPSVVLFSDRLVDTLPKRMGDFIFSTNGQPPGNNHHKYGGNLLMGDGSVTASRPQLELPALETNGIVLLNPKP